MRIALFGKRVSEEHLPYINKVVQRLSENNVEIVVFAEYYEAIRNSLNKELSTFSKHDDIKESIDYLISIGGDGTLLNTIRLVRNSGIPIMGINTGRLGFLSDIAKEEIENSIDLLLSGKFEIDKRTLLKLETKDNLFGDLNFALNELTVHKSDSASMISIHTYLDDEFLNSYWADGLIIATPTGSTAYSLSCSGPIIIPEAENLIINPIAPHNLNVRPVVVSDKSTIKLKVEGRSDNFLVSLDSRSEVIQSSMELIVRREDFPINLLRLEGQNFLSTLRNKLLWGLDKRN